MSVLRLWLTAGCVLAGAALGAAVVTVPPATMMSGVAVEVGVSVATESHPESRLESHLESLPASPPEPAPVFVPPAAPPPDVAAPEVVVPVEPAPEREPVRWAFTPNYTPERAQRSEVPESDGTRAPAMSSPTGSGGAATAPAAPEGSVGDVLTSVVRMAEQSRDVLGSLISGVSGD